NQILDEYREEKRSFNYRSQAEKKRDAYEVAAISRELIFFTGEFIGGVLGAIYLPNAGWKVSSLVFAATALEKMALGFSRLKTFNDIARLELKQRMKELEVSVSNHGDDEWWLR
ncbi:MAG TPA: hypothetical protein VGO47_09030, partial [Chlamydiales bacterium]|nr:hypothetical protein [Chlamydiales bacterium]